MAQIYLAIEDADSLVEILREAKAKTGMLKDISPEKVKIALSGKEFPMYVPIKMDGVLDIACNPIVKKVFGRKIEDTTKLYLKSALEAG